MPLSRKPLAPKRSRSAHIWGLDKSGKTALALSAPKPAMINFDRSEDYILGKMGQEDILRDRIVVPPVRGSNRITPAQARPALEAFEADVQHARQLASMGGLETLIIDGGALLTDIITIVTLDEATNPNSTFRYADRNSYIRNLFNELNESGINVIWTSKAKALWVGNQRVPNQYTPDCHDDVPYMVDFNVQCVAEPTPDGVNFYGVVGTNAFNPALTGKRILNPTWDSLMVLMGLEAPSTETPDA